jgi:hypothetical protein
LPPSIRPILKDFYKYNLISIIKSIIENIDKNSELFKSLNNITKNDIITYYLLCKFIQELVSDNAKNFIQQQSFKIVSSLIKKYNKDYKGNTIGEINPEMIIKSDDFELLLNKVDVDPNNPDEPPDKINIYQFSKVYDNFNENCVFIIYPEEYSNSDLLNSKYKLTLNENIFKILMDNSVNPYILDFNNQSAIFPVLKIHNYKIIKTLKNGYIDFREYSDMNAMACRVLFINPS